jgi:RHS repeat-associated protein
LDGVKVVPGQYYDQETNNYYNYFRDYDSATGRYLQSDPIGLAGGINIYLYGNANPVVFFDRNGLDAINVGVNVNLPFLPGAEVGVVIYDGTYGGAFGGAGYFDVGVYGSVSKHHGGYTSARAAIAMGQTLGCRSNFEGVDMDVFVGVGPVGVSGTGIGDSGFGNEGFGLYLGPALGYETTVNATGSITVGDIVRAIASWIWDSDVPWHGDDSCGCE